MFPSFAEMPFTYSICLLVIITSIIGFYNKRFYQLFVYHPYEVFRGKRLHTILTSALVHQKWWHLFFNLYVFYRINRDVEYIIMEYDFSFWIIELICVLVIFIGVVLPNLITGLKQKENIAFTSVGFSGAVFCSAGFCMLYLPLDLAPKTYLLFPFRYSYEFAFIGLAIFFLVALIFRNSKQTNHKLHLYAYVIGLLIAFTLRPKLVIELVTHLTTRFN
ncbi:Membrane associated serine protease, rhomboid family [Pedobacter xixiisoli]|uniref:Membrane associated serine protease, rhomboid family n=2 Tax=Pedobacter xixiisoli TaxID=1476464 RepID=A0A286ADB5_9SPHI|nr:Membrane associated serine protease, rhomboid family [Pedobacter xixiisoli]